MEQTAMGFGADIKNKAKLTVTDLFAKVRVEDLLKFGMIPEFMGRLPVIVTLAELDEAALVQVLTQPKNSIIKQFQKLFSYERVNLEFTQEALTAVAQEAIKRKTGARGLRAILEDVMLETMFDIPGQRNVKQVIVTPECIKEGKAPDRVLLTEEEMQQRQEQRARSQSSVPQPASTTAAKAKTTAKK